MCKGDEKGWRPIVWEIFAGNIPRIVELLEREADIFSGRTGGNYGLNIKVGRHNAVWAAESVDDEEIIKILAQYAPDQYLPPAVNRGYRKFVKAMIDAGVDVNTRDRFGYTGAMRAAQAGRLDDLQMLKANGATIGTDVLLMAIHSGNPNLVQTILDHDAELAAKLLPDLLSGKLNFSRISVSDVLKEDHANKGQRRIYRMIKKAINEVELPSRAIMLIDFLDKSHLGGETFWLAMKQHDTKTLQALIDLGIDIKTITANSRPGKFSYWLARANVELFEFFVDLQTISPDALNSGGRMDRSILSGSVFARNLPVAEKIMSLGGKAGIDLALVGASFSSHPRVHKSKIALAHHEERQLAIMNSLIKGGADVNSTEQVLRHDNNEDYNYERSPLTEAIASLQAPRVKLLLEHGAVAGSVDLALKKAESVVASGEGAAFYEAIVEYQRNLAEIKQLLADRGLY